MPDATVDRLLPTLRVRAFTDRVTAKLRRRRSVPGARTSFDRDSFASAFPASPAPRAASSSSTALPACSRTPTAGNPKNRKRSSLVPSCPVRRLGTETRSSTSTNTSSSSTTSSKMHLLKLGSSSSASPTGSNSPRPVAVPHTITEGHGGEELWVTAPMLGGEMEKQGFRWRKKWKTRYVELNSRMLSYYEVLPSSSSSSEAPHHHPPQYARKARRRAHITADAVLEDIDARSFAITPSPAEKPWVFRARDAATKLKWCTALSDCIDILAWLRHYELGDLLGVGGNGVVHEIVDTRDGRKFAVKSVDVARFRNRAAVVAESGRSMAGTVGYIAPEVVTAHAYSPAADVFSAGVILFILLVGYPPFRGDSEVEILLKIARGDFVFDRADWAGVSPRAQELVARMLTVRADERISVDDVLRHPWLTDEAADRELATTIARLQRFNFDRRSENMGSFLGAMLNDANEAEYKALVDTKTIGTMIRQLSPEGSDRIPLARAHVLAKGLGLSPFIDEKTFVRFLDQDRDGFISADDFCGGVKAVRNSDGTFAIIIFGAMFRVVGRDASATNSTATLSRADFVAAFDKLQCPEPLVKYFFKAVDKQHRPSPPEDDSQAHRPDGDDNDSDSCSPVDWEIDEAAFAELSSQYPFIWKLFLRTAKDNLMYVKSRSMDVYPQIREA
ncbi:hypothetical protein PybrP1_003988 [[Pythium] brassicae (nom. inval.)]|nr:hypothetical protein PybrP1_003988 [[Pythium] brassicae (nom. inval.)]